MHQIILYGISGAETQYRVLKYYCMYEEFISIGSMKRHAAFMVLQNPGIEHVYAIDNRYGLKREYVESYKKKLYRVLCNIQGYSRKRRFTSVLKI